MKDKTIFIFVALAGLFFQFLNFRKGNIKVEPIINYNKFLKWYDETVSDYNQDGSIPNELEWFQYWINKIKK